MSADQASNPVDLKQLRHDISGAIATLETAAREIRPHSEGADDGFELYELAVGRLKVVLASLDLAAER